MSKSKLTLVVTGLTAISLMFSLTACSDDKRATNNPAPPAAAQTNMAPQMDPVAGVFAVPVDTDYGTMCYYYDEHDDACSQVVDPATGMMISNSNWVEIEDPATDSSTSFYELMAWLWFADHMHLFDHHVYDEMHDARHAAAYKHLLSDGRYSKNPSGYLRQHHVSTPPKPKPSPAVTPTLPEQTVAPVRPTPTRAVPTTVAPARTTAAPVQRSSTKAKSCHKVNGRLVCR